MAQVQSRKNFQSRKRSFKKKKTFRHSIKLSQTSHSKKMNKDQQKLQYGAAPRRTAVIPTAEVATTSATTTPPPARKKRAYTKRAAPVAKRDSKLTPGANQPKKWPLASSSESDTRGGSTNNVGQNIKTNSFPNTCKSSIASI